MIALFIFTLISFVIFYVIYHKLSKQYRSIYILSLVSIFILGILSVTLYTVDNIVNFSQIDMPGDAQYYYYGAIDYLESGEITVYYPVYIRFISMFLLEGNVLTVRLGQLILIAITYGLASLLLHNLSVNKQGYLYFSAFTVLNGAIYNLSSVIVRDGLILFFIVLFIFSFFTVTKNFSNKMLLRLSTIISAIVLSITLYFIFLLQHFNFFILLFCIFFGLLLFILVGHKAKLSKKILHILIMIPIVGVLYITLPTERFINSLNLVIFEQVGIQEQTELTGGRGVEGNIIYALARFLLGPGLIRPLMPSEFFLVYTNIFAFFNLWATFVWYGNLMITLPLLIRKPGILLIKYQSLFIFLFIVTYSLAYAFFSGGPGGLRKRAIIYFMYNLLISITFFAPHDTKLSNHILYRFRIPISYKTASAIVVLLLLFSQFRGLD